MSTAILQLSESGDLQRIHDKWIARDACSSSQSNQVDEDTQLSLNSFWGLFLVSAIACTIALLLFMCRICWQYRRFNADEDESDIEEPSITPTPSPTPTRSIVRRGGGLRTTSFKDLMDFVDRKETEIKEMLKRKSSSCNNTKRSMSQTSDGQPSSTP